VVEGAPSRHQPDSPSIFIFGHDLVQNTATQPGIVCSKGYYASGNISGIPLAILIWGRRIDFRHGWQMLKNNARGDANRIRFSARHDLCRKE
jgi:hypothetical protein